MVTFHDRRYSEGHSDFNNPAGTFEVVSPGYAEEDRWAGLDHANARSDVARYFRSQKNTQTWKEANRLAKGRADREARVHGFPNGAAYGQAYHEHLIRVMASKGRGMAEQFGELHHPQSGYGRV